MYFRVPVTTAFPPYGRPECNPPPTRAVAGLGVTLVLTAAQRAGCVAVGNVFVPPFLLEEVGAPSPLLCVSCEK